MKQTKLRIISALLIPFFPLAAENLSSKKALAEALEAYVSEDAPLSSLEEELSLLDEEFEEFKEELFSIENELQKKEPSEKQEIAAETPNKVLLVPEAEKPADALINASSEIVQASPAAESAQSSFAQEVVYKEPAAENITPNLDLVSKSNHEEQEVEFFEEELVQDSPAILNLQGPAVSGELSETREEIAVDLNRAFTGSPIIYTVLLAMSIIAVSIWLYFLLTLHKSSFLTENLARKLENKLNSNQFDEALSVCLEQNSLFSKMVASGIQARRHGLPVMIEAMKAEGKRSSIAFWQKLGLLNDIAIIAPMIGLLGTVLGMFYAFYDINRSMESISTLFDGLGISVGTTVAGLIVAILALILHSTAKYRLVRALAKVENEAQTVATLIDDRTSIYNKG